MPDTDTAHQHPFLPPLRPPGEVLAWSENLLGAEPPELPCIALWRPAGRTAAVGISQDPGLELDIDALRRDSVGLVRRQSGGGAVLLYDGVLCWEALARFDVLDQLGGSGIRESYRVLCRPVVAALQSFGLNVFHAGICDISHTTGPDEPVHKLAGTAQLRRHGMALVHGSLLVNADLGEIPRYLKQPSEEPDYRAGRRHGDFCRTVAVLMREDEDLLARLAGRIVFEARRLGWETLLPPEPLPPAAEELWRNKYQSDEWNWRRVRPGMGG